MLGRSAVTSWARRLRGASPAIKMASAAAAVALVVALVAAVVSLAGSSSQAAPRALPAARNFTLQALGQPGKKIALADYAGKPVIVNFFASWCQPCQRETPLLARYYRDSGGRVVIIGVDTNDQASAALSFVRKAGVTYPVVSDPYPAATTTSWGVYGLPQTFFLNSRHRIVKRVIGGVTMKDLTAGVATMGGAAQAAPASRSDRRPAS